MKSISVKVMCKICNKELEVKPSRAIGFKTCSQFCRSKFMEGHRPFNYKGGKLKHKGYILILKKDHPNTDRDGYVYEHRLVMENTIGRFLSKKEIVHHIDRNRSNNTIENLQLVSSQSEHMKLHKFGGHNKKIKKINL